MTDLNLEQVRDTMVAVAHEAGRMILAANPADIAAGTKLNAIDIVTEADQAVEKMVAEAVGSEGVLALTDSKGRKIIVPAARIAYVEIGGALAGQVGFRS